MIHNIGEGDCQEKRIDGIRMLGMMEAEAREKLLVLVGGGAGAGSVGDPLDGLPLDVLDVLSEGVVDGGLDLVGAHGVDEVLAGLAGVLDGHADQGGVEGVDVLLTDHRHFFGFR